VTGRAPLDQEYVIRVRRHEGRPAAAAFQDGAPFTEIANPPGHFLADPSLLHHEQGDWLFHEDYDWSTRIGTLAVGRLADDGSLHERRVVLQARHHLSFPHVFAHDGHVFMIPESKARGQVILYRATRFPDDWTEEAILLDQPAVDTTVWQAEDGWYMFTTLVESRSGACAHVLLRASHLCGPWQLHPAAVLSTETDGIRSAGPLFRDGPRVIRPVQDVTRGYGTGLELREVTALDAGAFREHPVARLAAPPGFAGGHSYSRAGDWEAIDLTWFRPRRHPPGAGHP
jgi:hypothetical protein